MRRPLLTPILFATPGNGVPIGGTVETGAVFSCKREVSVVSLRSTGFESGANFVFPSFPTQDLALRRLF